MNHSAIHDHLQGILTTIIDLWPSNCCDREHKLSCGSMIAMCSAECPWSKLECIVAEAITKAELFIATQERENQQSRRTGSSAGTTFNRTGFIRRSQPNRRYYTRRSNVPRRTFSG